MCRRHAEPAHLLRQPARGQAELLGSAGTHAAGPAEDGGDLVALEIVGAPAQRTRRDTVVSGRLNVVGQQVLAQRTVRLRQLNGTLDFVFELAHVARNG